MTRRAKLLERIRANPRDVRFRDLCSAAEQLGFELKRAHGSHRLYCHPAYRQAALNLQPKAGKAKAYHVEQLLALVKEYNLDHG